MFVELTRGRSFAGLARYCLHDEGRRPTNDRVDFAVVRNLATEDPNVAWRLMVAKHYQQDRLKREAGVGPGGVPGAPVGHLVLSWKREEAEAERLDRARMIAAAEGALRAIGAARREAIIVAHNDTDHPHLHVILCLIEDDGRLKKNWHEHRKLSRWALQRERELHGEAIVKKREENWEARERGETPPSVKKRARHLFELERAAERDASLRPFVERHMQELRRLERRKAASTRRWQTERRRLLQAHVERCAARQRQHADRLAQARAQIRRAHGPDWRRLLAEQEASRHLFNKNERTLRGRVANTFRAVDWKAMVGAERRHLGPRDAMAEAFDAARDEGKRRRGMLRKQEREKGLLAARQQRLEKREQQRVAERQRKQRELGRAAYLRVSRAIERRRKETLSEQREEQQRLTRERNEALRASRERTWAERAAAKLKLSRRAKRREERPVVKLSRQERTDPLHLAGGGDGGADAPQAARQVDEAKVVINKRKRRERKPRKERPPRGGRGQRER